MEPVATDRKDGLEDHLHETRTVLRPPLFMVPLGDSSRLLRETCRLARLQGAPWLAVHLDLPRHLLYSRAEEARLSAQLRLVEELGGEVIQIQPAGLRGSREFLALAVERRATTIVVGGRGRSRWWDRITGSFLDDLTRDSRGVEIHVVPPEPFLEPARLRVPEFPGMGRLGAAVLIVVLATGIDFLIRPHLDFADLVMVYLLGITLVAARLGRVAALAASILSVAALDFCFVPPRFTFVVQDIRHVGTFAVMLGVGWMVANLTERIRAQARLALERERHTSALNRLGSVLAEGGSIEVLQDRVEAFLQRELGLKAHILLSNAKGKLQPLVPPVLDAEAADLAVAQWALEHGLPAGKGTDTLPGAAALYLPMAGTEHPVGVLVLYSAEALDSERGLLSVFAAQISLALERARLSEERTHARIRAEEEHLRNTLLSSVSHDLRTPLGTITGATSTLLAPGPAAAPEDQRLLLGTIHEEAGRLQRLVNNLLDLTKLESGQVWVKKEWVPLDEVVGSAISRMEDQLTDRPLSLEVPEAWVPLDPVLFEQVLLNLLDNALKYSPPGSPIEIHAMRRPEQVLLTISDQGPGIPEGEEERIFEKLYRGRGATKFSGAGLGLAIGRGIIQAHGGSICAINRREGGTQIQIILPIEGTPPEVPIEDTPVHESQQPTDPDH